MKIKKKITKNERLSIRLSSLQKDRLVIFAKKNKVSVNDLLCQMIEDILFTN